MTGVQALERAVSGTVAKYQVYYFTAGVPGGLVGYPRAYQNQFLREFNSHRVHIQVLVWTFSCIKNDQRKSREREFATFDENRRAVGMLNPMRDKD